MTNRSFRSIYTTVLLGVIFLLFVLSAVFTAFFLWEGRNIQEDELRKRGDFFASRTALLGELGVFSGNRELLLSLCGNVMSDSDIVEVSFYDKNGRLIAGKRSSGVIREWLGEEEMKTVGSRQGAMTGSDYKLYFFIAPVQTKLHSSELDLFSDMSGSDQVSTIGWTRVEMSGKIIALKNREMVQRSILIALVLTLAVAMMTYLFLKEQIRRPLKQLVAAVEEVGKGKLDQKIEVPVSNEIGILAEEFNRMAEALREREIELLRMAKAVEGANEGILISDTGDRVVYANPAFETMTKLERNEVLGSSLMSHMGCDRSGDHCKQFMEALEEGRPYSLETTITRKDGSSFLAEISISPIFNDRGEKIYTRLVERDITEKDRLEKSLMHSQKMEAVGTLAGGIAHDFNNILNGIIGYATLAMDSLKADGDKVQKHLTTIDSLGRRAAGLTQQLLGFARRGKYRSEPMSLNALAEEVAALLTETLDRRITIIKHLATALPLVKADANQLHQVVLNLCINARDAMPEGGMLTFKTDVILVDQNTAVKYKYEVNPGWYVQLAISDTGHGMEKETIERIFEPFFTTKEPGKGTGLGLAMVYGIIKNHGGFISVYSVPGMGTTFKIYLPRSEETLKTQIAGKEEKSMANETILVVDDEMFIRDMLEEMLTPFGYKVIAAGSGEECIKMLGAGQTSVDLVLMDLIMPGMGGKKAFENVKAMRPDIKVLISSGYGDEEDVRDILDTGAVGFVQKPYFRDQLIEGIRRALDA